MQHSQHGESLKQRMFQVLLFIECYCHHIHEENVGREYSVRGMNENRLGNLRGWRDETRERTIARASLMFLTLQISLVEFKE
jgi:hypothetical protein